MSLLSVAKTDDNIENETDFVGGGLLESGLYAAEVTLAWLEKKSSGAVFLNLTIKTDSGQEHREGLCLASGDAKGNKNYYETKTGERRYLPGFNTANSLALLACGKELGEMDTEQKLINVYNVEAKAEVPTKVEMVMDLLGARAIFGIQKQTVDKNAKGDDGQYHPTGETRDTNEIDKVFREKDRMTTSEIRAQADEAAFINVWEQKWTGKTLNKSASNDANGAAGAPAKKAASGGGAASASTKPKTSLFN